MSIVVIKECAEYKQDLLEKQLNDGMALLGGWERFVSPGMKVLLKINLIGPKKPDSAAVTHPEFVRALVRILKSRGCEVWVGDSSGGAIAGIAPTAGAMVVSGMSEVAETEKIRIMNFDREGVVEIKPESGFTDKMFIAKPMFDADLVINLPKFKTHSSGIFTGAVKNLFGCIPGLRKAEYHRLAPNPKDLGHVIADIHKAVDKVSLHIMDAVYAMQGEGPTAGYPYHSGKLLFSTDPLAMDTVSAAMLGMRIEDVSILVSASERNLGESSLEKIDIQGDWTKPPRLDGYRLPRRFRSTKKANYTALIKVIDFLRAKPRIDRKKCVDCNTCVESCPVGAVDKSTKNIDYGKCIECMCCHELCLHKAVALKRTNKFADLIMRLYRG